MQTANRAGAPSDGEPKLRAELAAAYRIIHRFGMTTLIQNHITVRLPGRERHFLINPYGLGYDEVTASSLVRIDIDGRVVEPGEGPFGTSVNPAGFVVHRAVHEAREDVVCAVHAHTVAGTAVAALECGLLPVCIEAMQFFEDVGYHPFEGVTMDRDECARLSHSLGSRRVLMLRNHGVLTVGRTVAEAVVAMLNVERACQVQLAAMATGRPLQAVSDAIARKVAAQARTFVPGVTVEELTFAALVRALDRDQPDYLG